MSAIGVALLVTELITQLALVATRAKGILETARAEGRDVTDEELASLASETDSTFDRLMRTK